FGRPGLGVSVLSGERARPGLQVACVNPVDPGGGSHLLHPYLPTASAASGASTRWTSYQGRVVGRCRSADGATWLEVTPTPAARGRTSFLQQSLGTLWGYHVADVNLALGDLVTDVSLAARTWHR